MALVRELAVNEVAPRAKEIDETATYPQDIHTLLAENDVLAPPFEEEHGGTGTGTLALQRCVEELAKADASCALILVLQEARQPAHQLLRIGRFEERVAAALRHR